MCEIISSSIVGTALSHLTKLDDSLLPRAQALTDFTASDDSHLSFKVCERVVMLHKMSCSMLGLILVI